MKKKSSHSFRKYLGFGVLWILLSLSVYAAVNLPWWPEEKQANGFLVMAGQNKNINVYSECKKVTATTKNVFVPTGTQNEWDKFKLGAWNVGASLGPCSGIINGVCSPIPTTCTSGTVSWDNGNTTPGGTRTWNCLGSGGGTNTSCNYVNPPASCVPNGSYSYGSCSVSCGGGSQDRFDSCGNYYDTQFTNCNPTACSTPSNNCTTPWWTTVTDGTLVTAYQNSNVAFGSSCVSQTATCNNGTLNLTYTHQNCTVDPAPSYTYTLSWSDWSDCSGSSCPGTQSRTPTCKRDQDNVIVDAATYCGVQNSDLTQSCTGHEKTGMPACASFPNRDVCAPDTYQCTSLGWANLWDGYCKNHNEVLCVAP